VCVARAKDRVELRFVVADVIILRKFFSDPDAASDFAIEKMHAYNAG
jgi:hypothetical protein